MKITVIKNPFRSEPMRQSFEDCIRMFKKKHRNLFADGKPHSGNSIANMFWMGYHGKAGPNWFKTAADKKCMAYAYHRAGQACRKFTEKYANE